MNPRELKFLTVAAIVAVGLGLAGCGGGGSSSTAGGETPVVEPEPTAAEAGMTAIAAATTAEAAQAAYDAVDQDAISGTERAALEMALAERLEMLATAARVESQKMALMNAAGMIDTSDLSTQDAIDAAEAAIQALQDAIDAAVDVDDTSMYQDQVDTAGAAVRMAQTGLDTEGRMMVQREAISSAVTAARTAVNAVNDTSTDAQVMAADAAVAALKAAIEGAADIPEGDDEVASAQGTHDTLAATLASAKTSRTAAMDEEERKRVATMAATAAKLHAAIIAPNSTTGADERSAGYSGTNDADLSVKIGEADAQVLKATKMEVDDNHGWAGKQYTASPTGGGTYEAVVYSDVGEPTQGRKFGSAEPGTGDDREYEYTLVSGALNGKHPPKAAGYFRLSSVSG